MAENKDKEQEQETRWIDAQIRWDDVVVVEPQDEMSGLEREKSVDDDDDAAAADIFADPHPQETFVFTEQPPSLSRTNSDNDDNNNNMIHVRLDGYKADSDAVWQSTGLTLWSAALALARYLLMHEGVVRPGQTILEVRVKNIGLFFPFLKFRPAQCTLNLLGDTTFLHDDRRSNNKQLGAGLGLCGIVAHQLQEVALLSSRRKEDDDDHDDHDHEAAAGNDIKEETTTKTSSSSCT
jgi:hypothetical protein